MKLECRVAAVENKGSPATAWLTLLVPFTASGQTYTGQMVLAVNRDGWEAEHPGAWPPKVGDAMELSLSPAVPAPAGPSQ